MDRLATTQGLKQLAQTWVRRLAFEPGQAHDTLVAIQGPAEVVGSRFALDRSLGRIGITRGPLKGALNAIQLPSPYVSEDHAALEAVSRGWCIVDLGADNHTYVGTVKVDRQLLVYGDEIRLGDVVLVYLTAERSMLPPHVVDPGSGLLDRRVFVAETTRALAEADHASPSLMLLQLPGLRSHPDVHVRQVAHHVGQQLLRRFPQGVLLGRLETDLFGLYFTDADQGRCQARELLEQVASVFPQGVRCGLVTPRGAGLARSGEPPLPQMMACLLAALEQAPAGGAPVEVSLEQDRLLVDGELLRALEADPGRELLVLTIEDEDRLRHHLGHDQLAACRWQLRQLVLQQAFAIHAPCGIIEQRVLVLVLRDPDAAEPVIAGLELALQQLWEREKRAPMSHGLRWAVVQPGPGADRGQLYRALISAVQQSDDPGPREPTELLPTAVAAPYGLVWVVASPTARVKTILDAAEVMTRFIVLVALATVAELDLEPDARRPLQQALWDRRGRPLTLGQWLGLLRELGPLLQHCTGPLAQPLVQAVGLEGGGVRLARLLQRQLLPQRNRFAHGELAHEEQRAEQAAGLLLELNALVQALSPLGQLQLLTVLQSSQRRSVGHRCTVRIHAGPGENFEVRQVEVRAPGPLFAGSTYLMTRDYRHRLELSPLLRLQRCSRCDREELFLADQVTVAPGATLELSAVSTGHRARQLLTKDDIPRNLLRLMVRPDDVEG